MSEEKTTGRRRGLDANKVAEAAKGMAAEKGFDGWRMRDLAKRLDVAPSVIYHYFSNREAVCDAVMELIARDIALPPEDLVWKEWFLQTARNLRAVLLSYNGAADRLMTNRFPAALIPFLDRYMDRLHEAGFDTMAPFAYAMSINVALGAIAGRDHRSENERKSAVDLKETLERIERMGEASDGMKELVEGFIGPLAEQDAQGSGGGISDRYFELLMRSVLDGIEVTLPRE